MQTTVLQCCDNATVVRRTNKFFGQNALCSYRRNQNVPSKNEVKAKTVNISDDITAKNDAEISNKPSENESTKQLININTADVLEFQKLDGIGEAKAKAIIAYRDSIGGFKTIEEIKNVSGIGESAFAKIKDCITV